MTRDPIVTQNITLDGVIDAAEGWYAPSGEEDVDQSDLEATVREHTEAADAFLVGRLTFEQMEFRSGIALLRYRTDG